MKFQKAVFLIAIPLAIWLFTDNFMPGYYLDQTGWTYVLYISFFNDLLFPICIYFVLCLFEKWIPQIGPWQVKVILSFLVPASIEIGQLIYQKMGLTQVFMAYGGAFDPLDLVVYGAGGSLAALLERRVFAETLRFWKNVSPEEIA